MKALTRFELGDGTIIYVEDDSIQGLTNVTPVVRGGEIPPKIKQKFEGEIEKVKPVSEKLISELSGLSKKPSEIEVEFGFKLSGSVGFVITSGEAEANFKVKLVWKQK